MQAALTWRLAVLCEVHSPGFDNSKTGPSSIKHFMRAHISLYLGNENIFIFLTGIKFTVLEVSFA